LDVRRGLIGAQRSGGMCWCNPSFANPV
jgi:hypothetical protein